jgi:hypothetical protein
MKKIFTSVLAIGFCMMVQAQTGDKTGKKLRRIANDHFMFQLTADSWMNKPDSIVTKGIGKGGNIYLMMNYPFKTNPKLSVGIGAGFGTSGIYLDKQSVNLSALTPTMTFKKTDTVNHFKKYKLANTYLEAPVEIRYTQHPENADKSFKFALGAKVGTLLDAHTKGKNLLDKNGTALNSYTEKLKQKKFYNSSRIALTARVGYGHFTVFGQYQLTSLFKDAVGPDVHPLSIGISIGGL